MQIQTKLTAHAVSFTRTKDAEWEVGIIVKNYTLGSNIIIDAYSKVVVDIWDMMDCESSGCFLIETTLEVQINGDLVVGETNHE